MTQPAFTDHDGYEFRGDPNADVEIVYRNGTSPKEPVKAASRRWLWKRSGPEAYDVVKWRVAL